MSDIRASVNYEGLERGREQLEDLLGALGDIGRAQDRARGSTSGFERALGAQATEARRASQEAGRTAEATERLGRASAETKQRLEVTAFSANAFGSALGQLSQAMRGVSPELQGVATGLDAVSHGLSVAQSMPGPLGIALGGLTTAFGVLSSATEEQSQRFEQLEQDAIGARTEIERTIGSINRFNLRRRVFSGEASSQEIGGTIGDVQARIQQREGDLVGQRAELARARRELEALEARRAEGVGGAGERGLGAGRTTGTGLENEIARAQREVTDTEHRIAALTGSLRSARRELDQLERAEDTAVSRESTVRTREAQGRARAQARRHGGGNEDAEAMEAAWRRYDQAVREGLEQQERRRVQMTQAILDASEQELIAHQKAAAEHEEAIDKATDGIREMQLAAEAEFAAREAAIEQLERQKEKERELAQQRLQSAREITDRVGDTLQTVASAYIDAFGQAIEGQATLEEASIAATKTILKGLGEEMVVMGIRETLEGFANLVSSPPVAATKIPMGIALIGVGVGLGAAGAAIPSAPAAAPERPRAEQDRDGGGGGQTLVVHNNYPIISTGTTAQLARQISRQIRSPEFPTRLAA